MAKMVSSQLEKIIVLRTGECKNLYLFGSTWSCTNSTIYMKMNYTSIKCLNVGKKLKRKIMNNEYMNGKGVGENFSKTGWKLRN